MNLLDSDDDDELTKALFNALPIFRLHRHSFFGKAYHIIHSAESLHSEFYGPPSSEKSLIDRPEIRENTTSDRPIVVQSETHESASSKSKEDELHFFVVLSYAHGFLSSQRQERLNQARITFFIAIFALTLGIILAFVGVICMFVISLPVGAATAASSIITNIISGLAFRFNKESNDRLDNTTRELSIVDRATVAMHYISYISDKDKRDEAIQELIAYLYQVTSNQNASKSEQEKKQ